MCVSYLRTYSYTQLSSESLDPVEYFLLTRTDSTSPRTHLVSLALKELYGESHHD